MFEIIPGGQDGPDYDEKGLRRAEKGRQRDVFGSSDMAAAFMDILSRGVGKWLQSKKVIGHAPAPPGLLGPLAPLERNILVVRVFIGFYSAVAVWRKTASSRPLTPSRSHHW